MIDRLYPDVSLAAPVCRDRHDDKFIACALASGCRLVVTGDRALLEVSGYRGVIVLKPRGFIERYLA